MIRCEVIKKRRSVRFYDANRKVGKQIILSCVEAATKAPSPLNRQPWIFRIIENHEEIQNIAAKFRYNRWICSAPVVIIVGVENSEGLNKAKNYLAIGAAIENLLLEAEQNNISTCWIGECLGKGMEEMLLWPKEYEIVSMIAVGYQREYELARPIKKSVNDVLV